MYKQSKSNVPFLFGILWAFIETFYPFSRLSVYHHPQFLSVPKKDRDYPYRTVPSFERSSRNSRRRIRRLSITTDKRSMAPSESDVWTLETVRDSLIRQEDTIIFCLIERAKYPFNKNAYDQTTAAIPGRSGSLAEIMIQEAEALFAKFGRYENPEEHPFFPENLPGSGVPTVNFPQIFHPAAASVNVNPRVWDAYFNQLLPRIAEPGDDGNYASAVSCDLACLQALSRRIHFGKYVAEVKFRDETKEYEPAIRARDRDALMKLLTFKKVEEMVKRRVEKKAMIFGQEVTLVDGSERRKIDPGVVSHLYDEWVMPLTKEVEVEYLLRRLD